LNDFNKHKISLRGIKKADKFYLNYLFTVTRVEDFSLLWHDIENEYGYSDMTFTAQESFYKKRYPDAKDFIVMSGDLFVGRIIIEETERYFRLIEIMLLPEFRNNGIGGSLLSGLLRDAQCKEKTILLNVYKENKAFRLYKRFGFVIIGETNFSYCMRWKSVD